MALIRDLVLQLAVWLAAGAATTVPTDSLAQVAPDPEYQLKAVFLFNFAQFVEWPASAFPNAETPLVIGILGEDPFGAYLDETVRGETVNDRPLVVRPVSAASRRSRPVTSFSSAGRRRAASRAFSTVCGAGAS